MNLVACGLALSQRTLCPCRSGLIPLAVESTATRQGRAEVLPLRVKETLNRCAVGLACRIQGCRGTSVSDDQRIKLLEHRVRELQTAVVAIVHELGIEQRLVAVELARLEEIRRMGEAEAPGVRLIKLYGGSQHQ